MISKLSQYEDLESLLYGEKLGVGIHREVGVYKPDPTLVIKIAYDCPNINILEDEIWMMVKDTNIAKWFAPVVAISQCGIFMLQKRVEMRPESEYPKFIPSFFGDLKYKNFGFVKGQLVCCDYAGFIASSMVHKWNGRMVKARWWK